MSDKRGFNPGRYDFLGKSKYFVPFTILLTLFGVFEMAYQGLNYGIDFAGGTELQVQYQNPVDVGEVRLALSSAGFEKATVQALGDGNEVLVRVESVQGKTDQETNQLQNKMITELSGILSSQIANNSGEVRRVDSVGPQVGDELKRNSILAALYALFMILIYIGFRFDFKYAPGAVFCLVHDAIVTMSIFAIMGREVNVQTLASVLTLIGYSLNDTIVTFDRIRENEKLYRGQSFTNIANRAINDMLSRTILTGITTELAIMALYFLSDGVIQQIAFTLMVGILIGTFSSIFVAAPMVVLMDKFEEKREQARLRTAKA